MSQDEFTKLFKYMQEFRSEVTARFDKNDRDHGEIHAAIAELGGQVRDYHQEMLMMAHKVDRLERWIQQVAQATGVRLEY